MSLLGMFLLAACVLASTVATSQVIEIAENPYDTLKQGIWFLELYLPDCSACKQVQPVWEQTAKMMSGSGVDVARLNSEKFDSAAHRFPVSGYPAFFLLRDGNVWQYKGDPTPPEFQYFALEGWKDSPELGLKSPFSVFAMIKVFVLKIERAFEAAHEDFVDLGLSKEWSAVMLLCLFVLGLLVSAMVGTSILGHRAKKASDARKAARRAARRRKKLEAGTKKKRNT